MTETLPYIDHAEVLDLVPFADAVSALAEALAGGLDPDASPPRSVCEVEHGQLLLMPAETVDAVGVKLGTVAPGNPDRGLPRIQALYVLYDPVTLAPLALLDGTALTTLRTPAVSAVAVDHLASPEAEHLLVFGSGPQAWGHVEAVRAVRPIRRVTVVGRDRGRAEHLAGRVRSTGLAAAAGSADRVGEADIVVCATSAREPLFDGALLSQDVCVVAVGSHEPEARELDDATMRRARRVVVETRSVALREAGDVVQAVKSGALLEQDLVDLRQALAFAPTPGTSVFKSVGMGWQDLVVADLVHRRWAARREG
jgi:ornithine cyclodeaminase/alanine dehydrogenase-like protein (mu-crystallin family)